MSAPEAPHLFDLGDPEVGEMIDRFTIPSSEGALPVSDKTLRSGEDWYSVDSLEERASEGGDERNHANAETLDIGYDLAMDSELLRLGRISTEDRENLVSTNPEVLKNALERSTEGIFRELGLPAFMADFVDIEKQADIREFCRTKLNDGLNHDTQDLLSRKNRYREVRQMIETHLGDDRKKLEQFKEAQHMWAEEMYEFPSVVYEDDLKDKTSTAPGLETFRPQYGRDRSLGKTAIPPEIKGW